jgi:hypothetical protein
MTDQGPSELDVPRAMPIGQEAEVPDAYKVIRQHVHQETAHELNRINAALFDTASVGVVPPHECDLMVRERDNSAIADGDAVRIARQILENLLRTTKWRFRVNHPLLRRGTLDGDVWRNRVRKSLQFAFFSGLTK